MTMYDYKFGIEIELTGITREKAASVLAETLGGTSQYVGGQYNAYEVTLPDERKWKVVSDASIHTVGGYNTSVELVSPILNYHNDIDNLQEIIRMIKAAGGKTNSSCGIHIHLDGEPHNAKSLKNFINIIASRNDLLYEALQIEPSRMRYCQKMDARLVNDIKKKKPKTEQKIKDIWYNQKNAGTYYHYHESRYHFLNLHSYFNGVGTVELRGFNSSLKHAGVIKAYILLALALNHQALTQTKATSRRNQDENKKFAMRIYLNRIGFIGPEMKNYREHLLKHLDGSSAWRYGYDNPKYKKNQKIDKGVN